MEGWVEYGAYLVGTAVIELVIVRGISRRWRPRPLVVEILAFNLLTHPLATLAVIEGAPFVATEGAVILVESLLYASVCRLPRTRAALLGITANLVTALIAVALG